MGEDRDRVPVLSTVWVVTWVFPLSFMLAMAYGCDSSARALGRRAVIFYDSKPDSAQAAIAAAKQQRDAGHNRRQVLRAMLLVFSVAIPLAFIAFVDHERQSTGITPLTAVGGLVALSLVIHGRHRYPPLDVAACPHAPRVTGGGAAL